MPLPHPKRNSKNTVGADPEVFFMKDGKYFPAIGLVGGTKHSPRKVKYGAVQEDNVMAEFNIPPANTADRFSKSIADMLAEIEKIAAKNGCQVAITPYAEFENKYLAHPQAQDIGCTPDYNAWTITENERPTYELLGNIRTASGHVHLGIPDPDSSPTRRIKLIAACDLYLGLPSLFLDNDLIRRKYYGKAGAYRPKPYGAEYRVLSNFWIKDDVLRKWVFASATNAMNNFEYMWNHIRGHNKMGLIQSAINKHDLELAASLLRDFGIPKPK